MPAIPLCNNVEYRAEIRRSKLNSGPLACWSQNSPVNSVTESTSEINDQTENVETVMVSSIELTDKSFEEPKIVVRLETSRTPTIKSDCTEDDEKLKTKTKAFSLCFPFLSCFSASMGSFSIGLTMACLNTSMEHISRDIDWCISPTASDCSNSSWHKLLVQIAIFGGLLFGSLIVGHVLKYGRRFSLMLFSGLHIITACTCAISTSYITLLWGRFITGITDGGLIVCVTVYISEISPAHLRGAFTSLNHVMLTFGEFIIVILGIPLHPFTETNQLVPFDKIWWRSTILITCVPSIILLIIFSCYLTFETPQFYARHQNDFISSSRVIKMMNSPDKIIEAEDALAKAIQGAREAEASGLSFYSIISNPQYRYVLFVGVTLSAIHQVTGINYYISSSNRMLLESGLTIHMSTLVTSLMMLAHFVFTLPVFWLIETLGRRKLLLYGTILMILPLVPVVFCLWWIPDSHVTIVLFIAGTIWFMIVFSCSYGPVVWCFVSEIFPLEIKHVGTSTCSAVHWGSALIVVGISQLLPHRESTTIFFFMAILALAITYLFVYETKSFPVDSSPYVKLGTS